MSDTIQVTLVIDKKSSKVLSSTVTTDRRRNRPTRRYSGYEKRCADIILAKMRNNKTYSNAEFEAFLVLGGEKRTGVGPTITYMRRNGLIESPSAGKHKLVA